MPLSMVAEIGEDEFKRTSARVVSFGKRGNLTHSNSGSGTAESSEPSETPTKPPKVTEKQLDTSGWSAFMLASFEGRGETAQELLKDHVIVTKTTSIGGGGR
jgi:hypothetical protein